tara:strand:- start:83 stop:184 length:102 start_codon:yes stop_codon:yes gene_type:complete
VKGKQGKIIKREGNEIYKSMIKKNEVVVGLIII